MKISKILVVATVALLPYSLSASSIVHQGLIDGYYKLSLNSGWVKDSHRTSFITFQGIAMIFHNQKTSK